MPVQFRRDARHELAGIGLVSDRDWDTLTMLPHVADDIIDQRTDPTPRRILRYIQMRQAGELGTGADELLVFVGP